MNRRVLFFGDVLEPALQAQMQYPESVLLTKNNLADYFDQSNPQVAYHTGLADLPNDQDTIWQVLDHADEIVFCPPNGLWSDGKQICQAQITTTMQGYTEFLLYTIHKNKNNVRNFKVDNLAKTAYVALQDHRQTEHKQIWICGCSISHGYGVSEHERFGDLLGRSLKLPVSWLTFPGSSIPWAADQILRSDIKPNDIVVWGLTSENRSTWVYSDESLAHLTPFTAELANYKLLDISSNTVKQTLNSKQMLYQAILSVHQVNNFCSIVGAKLLIVGLISSQELNIRLGTVATFFPYYNVDSIDKFIDLGTDKLHPGPKQHALYHKFIKTKLKNIVI